MYEAVRRGIAEAVPFARYVGVELLEVGDGSAKAMLAIRPDVTNHVGTLHAGALFTLAETASGAAVMGAFIDMIAGLRPVAAGATITYLKLARSAVTCIASIGTDSAELKRRLQDHGSVTFDVTVDMHNEDQVQVATMIVSWNVKLTVG